MLCGAYVMSVQRAECVYIDAVGRKRQRVCSAGPRFFSFFFFVYGARASEAKERKVRDMEGAMLEVEEEKEERKSENIRSWRTYAGEIGNASIGNAPRLRYTDRCV